MKPLEIYTEIYNGKLNEAQKRRIADYLALLGDGFIHIYIDRKRKPVSNRQRNYYWGYLMQEISEEYGYTKDEAHELCKSLFLKAILNGEEKILSTETLSSKEREDYHEKIRRYFAVQGLNLREPNEEEDD